MHDPRIKHPARWNRDVLEAALPYIEPDTLVHDPFAGTGERLGEWCDRHGFRFSGTEIEESFIVDPRVCHGDSTIPETYPTEPHVILTSPVYPNGMADHFKASDSSKRNTYRSAVAANEGADRPLDINNMGRWGYRGAGPRSEARLRYWDLATRVVRCWRERGSATILVNVKDFYARGELEPVVRQWRDLLEAHGFYVVGTLPIKARGLRHGANHSTRVNHETLISAKHDPGKSAE